MANIVEKGDVGSKEAIDSLLSIGSADISEIRLMMDVLLEVYLDNLLSDLLALNG